MEDVLDLYEEEYDAERPVVCFDETSKQLIGHTRAPICDSPIRPVPPVVMSATAPQLALTR